MARAGRGAAWETILRSAQPDVDPRWTLTGRGSRAVLTWGDVGWVWQHVGLNLRSGGLHELYASRTWTDAPLSVSIDRLPRDLLPDDSTDRLFELDDPDAVGQVRRWAALVPDQVFARTREEDLQVLEWEFDKFQSEGGVARWLALPGLQVVAGQDARRTVDAAYEYLAEVVGPDPRGADTASLSFWREFRGRLDDGRDATLAWLDAHRRRALHERHVPDDLVADVLDGASPSR